MSSTSSAITSFAQRFAEKRESIIGDYLDFLRFASVSSEPSYQEALHNCLTWLQQQLSALPFQQQVWEVEGRHPTLFATYDGAGPDQPTLLIYNHYDVQPVDPLEEWESPPFEPTIRDGQVYARGAVDDKGQCFYVLEALRALYERDGKFPINIKWCIEGEEEIGSVALSQIMGKKKAELAADYLLVVDVGVRDLQSPSVSLGVRGIVTMEVSCRGSSTDMHSGMVGGVVYNPIHALVEVLSKLRDAKGKVAVPGFYDGVKPVTEEERAVLDLAFDAAEFRKTFAAEATGGEQEFPPMERACLRPTIEVNGIWGGYTGPGFKTVIPATASAKLSCRLVPGQDPANIGQLVSKFLIANTPPGMVITPKVLPGSGAAVRADATSPLVTALSKAYTEVFGKPCTCSLTGGSIPIGAELAAISGAQILLVGVGLSSDKIHAPNEHFGLDRLEMGYLIIARAIELLAQSRS